ncbi:MAG: RuBisCO large subunit C-terminal-like domain-containing protein [Actinobacteria bacterium]|nr:RuBisCO large subunit C-terminal-like domain-containing protein [Cyanobacteriota bacterium]MCL6087268.1 RuBisCO large subunit C-terminal-like domain-containing protein [Actinomycetota bacterium]
MINKSLHFLPDGFDREEYIISTFFIELPPEKDIIKFSEVLAVDMSTGTWTAVEGETEEMREKYAGKVLSCHEIPNYEFELPEDIDNRRYVVSIAIPFINIGPQIPMLLTTIIGNISVMGRIKLLDIEFPKKYLKDFKGPKFGINGIRKLLNIPVRPLLNNMIKPCTGFTPEVGAKFFYSAASGGVDIIKDDELLSETPYNNRVERIKKYMEMEKLAFEIKGEHTLYCVNITGEADKLLVRAKEAIEAGANALMVNYLTQGLSSFRCLAESNEINVPVLAHLDFSGVLYANPYGGLSSHLVLGKLARIIGADMIVYPMESGKYRLLDERYRQIAYDLILPLHNIKPTLPIPAGGVYPGIVPKIISELGFDCAISAGGAIHGHPLGAAAGAKAFRQAIDAVVANIDLDEYAKNHEELKVALEKWK